MGWFSCMELVRTMPECPELPVLLNWRFSPTYFFSLPSMPIGVEVTVGATWGLMSPELRHSLSQKAEHNQISLWSKGKLTFHVPPLSAIYTSLRCFKRRILG